MKQDTGCANCCAPNRPYPEPTQPDGPSASSGHLCPTLRLQVKELQDKETGELLRVFEENQSNSGGSHAGRSSGSGGGGSHSGRPPPHPGSSGR